MKKKRIYYEKLFIALITIFALMQFIPYGERAYKSKSGSQSQNGIALKQEMLIYEGLWRLPPQMRHKWPWYSNIAPLSWMIYNHVEEGREHFNISMWGKQKKNEGDAGCRRGKRGRDATNIIYISTSRS